MDEVKLKNLHKIAFQGCKGFACSKEDVQDFDLTLPICPLKVEGPCGELETKQMAKEEISRFLPGGRK